jgi:FtsP/CotA-like multicopper oxidase with cupredoxin domain
MFLPVKSFSSDDDILWMTLATINSYLYANKTHPGTPAPAPGELYIPPLIDAETVNGTKTFTLNIQEGRHTFFPGTSTRTYGINGNYLGPTLYMRKGEKVSITYTNSLRESTTMHGHGMHVPAAMDGGPHQVIHPGKKWRTTYTVNQKACTNWYHPHYMGKTAEQVYKGLAGLIYIEDEESLHLGLPNQYALNDLPLVIQDRIFDANKQLDYSPTTREIRQGYRGNTFLVNGVISPYFNAEASLLRLRILNGSNARVYRFAFSDDRDFHIIAGDNSFLKSPVRVGEVTLSPGERAEIIVDLTYDFGEVLSLIDLSSGAQLLELKVNKRSTSTTSLPSRLTSTLQFPNIANVVRTRRFDLGMANMRMAINRKTMNLNRIDEYVPLNAVEIWEVRNTMNMNHNFHIHATHFIVLERNGSSANVKAHERGYKDVVFMPPQSRVKLLVKMTDYRDKNNAYMYHCHILEHEDDGMMGQFVVT